MTLGLEEYAACDAVGLRALITAREVTAAEVETVARCGLDAANTRVNGLAAPPFTPALEHASDGPLGGVPFLIKDFGPMAKGVPFFCGSRGVPGIRPDHDSDLMTRVRAAGLVTLGLTTAPEDRARQRRGRLAPHPRLVLRPGRAQAEPRPHPSRTGHGRAAVRADRAVRPHSQRPGRRSLP